MLIRLIGPVRIERDGVTETISAAKRACVLAVLAARPGVPVSQADLIDRVWDGRPPETVVSVLYSYITRLRTSLKGTSAEIRRAGARGYVLDVPLDEIDVHAARALAAEADGSLDRWRRACELADGTALSGIEGTWAREFRETFAKERLHTLNARHTAELAAGNHEAVLPEIIALADAEPMYEPFAHSLMLAYVRCGRPAEALACFEAVRVRLRDRLGADPSEELRRLHVRILDQDPGLRLDARAPGPAMLPADIGSFTGREDELAALDDPSAAGSRTAAITGPGGSGKTALAVHWGHSRRADFPDGQLYVNLRGFDRGAAVSAGDALERLLTALGVAGDAIPSDVDGATTLYRSLTADRRLLVVLDNARDADQVRPLLPGNGCTTLVTSRDRLAGLVAVNDARPVPVPVLTSSEALELIGRVLGPERVTEEKDAAVRFAELCGHLPLALRIAAANLAVQPGLRIGDYVAELEGADPLRALSVEGDAEATVAANLELSYRVLAADARGLLARIGTLPGEDVSRELLEAIAGLDGERLSAASGHLLAGHLLEEHLPGRYRMHDLVRLYAKGKAEQELEQAARDELIDGFIEWHFEGAYRNVGDEQPNALIAADALREHPRVWRLVIHLNKSVGVFRLLDQARRAAEGALRNARAAGDAQGMFHMTVMLSVHAGRVNDHERALALSREAVSLAEPLDADAVNTARNNLAAIVSTTDYAESADLFAASIDADLAARARGPMFPVHNFVTLCVALLQPDRADAYVKRFEAAYGEDWSELERARFGIQHARIAGARGRITEAVAIFDGLAPTLAGHKNTWMETMSYHYKAMTLHRTDRLHEAADAAAKAVETAERAGFDTFIEALLEASFIQSRLGEPDAAERLLDRALERQPRPTSDQAAFVSLDRGMVHLCRGEHERAAALITEAAASFRGQRDLARLRDSLDALADAHDGLGDTVAAARGRSEAAALGG